MLEEGRIFKQDSTENKWRSKFIRSLSPLPSFMSLSAESKLSSFVGKAFKKKLRRHFSNGCSLFEVLLLRRRSHLWCLPELQCHSNVYVWPWTLLIWTWILTVTCEPTPHLTLGLSPWRTGVVGQALGTWPCHYGLMRSPCCFWPLTPGTCWPVQSPDQNLLLATSES